MNIEFALELADKLMFARKKKYLNDLQRQIFLGAWEGKTYQEIADTCFKSYQHIRDEGSKLWQLLSDILEEEINKGNFRAALEREWRALQNGKISSPEESFALRVEHSELNPIIVRRNYENANPRQDWGEAPDVSTFYGRTEELATLEQWIVNERCRLVAILGLGGIGKTSLSVKLTEQIHSDFEIVIWHSLQARPFTEILPNLVESLSNGREVDGNVSRLTHYLHQRRCLLILDDVEAILCSNELAGKFREEYKGYEDLIRQVAVESHQSCLLLIGREQPRTVSSLAARIPQVRLFLLHGLQEEDARKILSNQGLSDLDRWGELIELYRANPASLKIISLTIQRLFKGKVSEFIKQNTVVIGDISELLDSQFNRLSIIEEQIMYWLAIIRIPVSFLTLQDYLKWQGSKAKLFEALESLERRSLIEKDGEGNQFMFSLQPVLMKYVTTKFAEEVTQEILELIESEELDNIALLRNYPLVTELAVNNLMAIQFRLIVTPIKFDITTRYRNKNLIVERLNSLRAKMQTQLIIDFGYAVDNVQILLDSL